MTSELKQHCRLAVRLKTKSQPCFLLPLLTLALLACAIACGGAGAGSLERLTDDDSSANDDDNDNDDNDDDVSPPADDDDDDDDSTPQWSVMWNGKPGSLFDVWGSSGFDVFASGDQPLSGVFLHYDGSSWSPVPGVPSTDNFSAIWGISARDIYAGERPATPPSSPRILHYDGSTWSAVPGIPQTDSFGAIWGSSATDVFAAGTTSESPYSGVTLHYDGSSWSPVLGIPPTDAFAAVWGSSAEDVFAVGTCGGPLCILHYDGFSWSSMTIPDGTAGQFGSVWGSSSSDVFVSATGIWGSSWSDAFTIDDPNGILHYDGSAWSPMTGPQRLELLSAPLETRTSDNGYDWIWHYDGFTWSGMNLPAPPGATANSHSATPILRGIWGSSPSDVFAVGQYGYGETWNSIIYHYGY